jgi:hypothetical protein
MTREEKISQLNDIFAEINENDNAVCYLTSEDNELIESAIEALSQESCYNPDEWCRTCSEYDQDKHCCPRYNGVIRKAVEEIKRAKVGHWISYWDEEARCYVYKCPECGNKQPFDTKCCWECGTRLFEPQESEETDERG